MDANETRRHRVELLATILLAVTAVATAWSTYQSTQWMGQQAADNSKASAACIESSQASTRAGQLTQIDVATMLWVHAYLAGDTGLADIYRQRSRPEFKPAFDAWLATDPLTTESAPASPFAMPQYRVAEASGADRLNAVANARSDAATTADERSDKYMLAVVLFASALFFTRHVHQAPCLVQTFGGPKGQFVDPPKNTGIYATCGDAPAAPPPCVTAGAVGYEFDIGEFEVTVSQYVAFLNTVDREGKNPHDLYIDHMSPTVWPKYGSISYAADAGAGEHYAVAYPEWADKPLNFGDFRRGARFVNSMTNGTVLSKQAESLGGFNYVSYNVRLSPETETGMYEMSQETPTRTTSKGFVLPSNDEWVKAAYYELCHGVQASSPAPASPISGSCSRQRSRPAK